MNPETPEGIDVNTPDNNVSHDVTMSVQVIKEKIEDEINLPEDTMLPAEEFSEESEEEHLSQEDKEKLITHLETIQKELEEMEVGEDVETLQSELESTIIDTYVESIFNIGDIQRLIAQKPGSLFKKETLDELESLHSKMTHHIETNVRKFRKQTAKSAVPKQQKEEMMRKFNGDIKPLKEDVINLFKLISEIKKTRKIIIEKAKEQKLAQRTQPPFDNVEIAITDPAMNPIQ